MFLFKYIKYILNCIEKTILPAKKGSRQRALCHLPKKAVGKELRHLTTAFVPFADCHTGRWQRLCRLLFSWQVAKVSLPTNSLPRVLCRLPRVKQSAKPLPPVLGPLPTAFGSRQRTEFQ